jgi:hypothetical protein
MKNEEKIIELLSEYLLKTDRTLERMEKNDKKFDEDHAELMKHAKKIDLAYEVLMKHSDELISLRKETEALRKESLKREIQQEALLKEIFSISRRVANIEDEK